MGPYKKICVVGPGAIGGTVAVRLALAGYEVSTLAPPPRAKRIAEKGITLIEEDGQTYHANFRSADNAADLGPQDLVAVVVKNQHLPNVAESLEKLCGPDTPLVFMMNGVPWWFFHGFGGAHAGSQIASLDPTGLLSRVIPTKRIVWAIIEVAAKETPEGAVHHYQANRIVMGRPDDRTAGMDEIAKPFLDAKFQVRTAEKIRDAIWSKLEGNAALSPVAALSNSIGTRLLVEDPLLRDLTLGIIAETRAVGEKLGLAIDPYLGDTYARMRDMKPPMTEFRPSMLQDLERNRPLELNAISVATIEIGDRVGVPMPLSKAVLGLLRSRVLSMGLPIN